MDKGKKVFVETDKIKEINELANKTYDLKMVGNIAYNTFQDKLILQLLEHAKKYRIAGNILNQDDICSCANLVIVECLNKWEPGRAGFWAYYKNKLDKRLMDEIAENKDTLERGAQRKRKRMEKANLENKEETSSLYPKFVRESYYNNSDDTERDFADDSDIGIVEDIVDEKDVLRYVFEVVTDLVMAQKKNYENKKTFCYATLFFSEFVTKEVHEGKNPSFLLPIENRIMMAVDHDYISYYMEGKNNSLYEISKGKLKKLSCFTNNPQDEIPCGYPISEKYVIVKYVALVYDTVTRENISRAKKDFEDKIIEEAIISTKRELGIISAV